MSSTAVASSSTPWACCWAAEEALPNSPTRAASIEPLTASMLVWMPAVEIAPTILSIRPATCTKAVS